MGIEFNIKEWLVPVIITLVIGSICCYFGIRNGMKEMTIDAKITVNGNK